MEQLRLLFSTYILLCIFTIVYFYGQGEKDGEDNALSGE